MDIQVFNTVILNDKEYSIIDMKYIRALDKKNPFMLEHLGIERGEILIGDYVRSIKAVWAFVDNELMLKEITYKRDAFTFSGLDVGETKISSDGIMETDTLMYGFEFTGRLRLARDCVYGQSVENTNSPLTFNTVVDITLHNDRIVGVIDRSQEVEEWRLALKKKGTERIIPLIDL